MKSLTELRQWNFALQRAGAIKYGQANLDISEEMNLQADRERYAQAARERAHPAGELRGVGLEGRQLLVFDREPAVVNQHEAERDPESLHHLFEPDRGHGL